MKQGKCQKLKLRKGQLELKKKNDNKSCRGKGRELGGQERKESSYITMWGERTVLGSPFEMVTHSFKKIPFCDSV